MPTRLHGTMSQRLDPKDSHTQSTVAEGDVTDEFSDRAFRGMHILSAMHAPGKIIVISGASTDAAVRPPKRRGPDVTGSVRGGFVVVPASSETVVRAKLSR